MTIDSRLYENLRRAAAARSGPGANWHDCIEATTSAYGNPFKEPRLEGSVWELVLRYVAGRLLLNWRGDLDLAAARCESPIEELLLLALALVGINEHAELILGQQREPTLFSELDGAMRVMPQVEVGKYRVDFEVTSWVWTSDVPGRDAWRRASMLIECDGHDFHERTKDQASRDKRRDRDLQAAGFTIYRYTGSDVWRDPFGVAEEIVRSLQTKARNSPPLADRARPS